MDSIPSAVYSSLQDRVVIVTGGASGIGAAIVEAFALQKAKVVFLDVQDDAAEALVQRLRRPEISSPVFFHCDLSNIDELQRCVKKILESFPTVDVLVNNAGNDKRHRVEEVDPDFWDWCLQINLKHQFFMAQAVLPGMRRARRGSIINMSSIAWAIPSTDVPVYVTAKAAIVGMTRTLAHEVGKDGIRVNCVMPGAVFTERQTRLWLTEEYRKEILSRQALKIEIQPEQVAKLILFLASDESLAITNQSLVIDAGWI
jgi:NAD(P)-dependent dehydrogenase (short-subunit alcohol dehydrogenase family)